MSSRSSFRNPRRYRTTYCRWDPPVLCGVSNSRAWCAMHKLARWLRLGALACLCTVTGVAPRAERRPAAPAYTIAVKSFAPNNTDIFIADGDGQHPRPLTPDTALDYNASFSFDGRWIVFT